MMSNIMKIIKKIPNAIYLFIIFILLIIDAIGLGAENIIEKIKFSQIAEKYETLKAICPSIESVSKQYIVFFISITVLVCVAFILKLAYKEKLYVLEHFSFNEVSCGLANEERKKYRIISYSLHQNVCFEDGFPKTDAIYQIRKKIDELRNAAKNNSIGYYGVAHVPFVFLAGFILGDQSKIHVFHRKRHNDEEFEELGSVPNYDLRLVVDEKNKTIKSSELIVVVSTSLQITKDEVIRSFGNDKHILMLRTNNIGYDQLLEYDSIEHISKEVWAHIRRCTKEYSIERIHMLIASSVAFSFFLGRKCSANIDPHVVVYHYQNGIYPWGVKINGGDENDLIIRNEIKNEQ